MGRSAAQQSGPPSIRLASATLRLELEVGPGGPAVVAALGPAAASFLVPRPADRTPQDPFLPMLGIEAVAEGRDGTAGKRHVDGLAGQRLRYVRDRQDAAGPVRCWEIDQADDTGGLRVRTVVEHHEGTAAFRMWHVLTLDANAERPVPLGYVASLALGGMPWSGDVRLWTAANPWSAEHRWHAARPAEYGLYDSGMHRYGQRGTKNRIAIGSAGAWSSSEYLPMGAVEWAGSGRTLLWEIEHNGSWQFELGDRDGTLYLTASGPCDPEHQWHHQLAPGASFTTVPVNLAVSEHGIEGAVAEITAHRRVRRRRHEDNARLPVVFNDFMNCLMGEPDTERLLPLVDAAAAAGAEVFCIDAGWFDDAPGAPPGPGGVPGWWTSIGLWAESPARFPEPGGLRAVTERIRERGMVPGLWLEPECVGVRSTAARALPGSAFFQRCGRRVTEWGRHQLNLSDPAARAFLDGVVDRLIRDYGLGYLKLDYNIDAGVGTDLAADSPGDGLLRHNREYLGWLDRLLDRHPGLTVENCAAGGSRTDQALLSRLPIQSLTDQQDHRLMPAIAAAAPMAVPPEQGAVWAYPQPEFSAAENAFTMASAMLGRVHLSGRIDLLDQNQAALVRHAVSVYKTYRHLLPTSVPHWPLGLPGWDDGLICLVLECTAGTDAGPEWYVLLWRREETAGERRPVTVPLPYGIPGVPVEVLFASDEDRASPAYDAETGLLTLTMEPLDAVLMRLRPD
jgi:alpha-galactosidase